MDVITNKCLLMNVLLKFALIFIKTNYYFAFWTYGWANNIFSDYSRGLKKIWNIEKFNEICYCQKGLCKQESLVPR